MTFSERMRDALEQGWAVSKELAAKAGAKAQDLGERGILMLEIKQLENQAQKLLSRMGTEAYFAFTDKGQGTINREDLPFKTFIEELGILKDAIEKKEADLRDRKAQ
jgi:hypothetical protein